MDIAKFTLDQLENNVDYRLEGEILSSGNYNPSTFTTIDPYNNWHLCGATISTP